MIEPLSLIDEKAVCARLSMGKDTLMQYRRSNPVFAPAQDNFGPASTGKKHTVRWLAPHQIELMVACLCGSMTPEEAAIEWNHRRKRLGMPTLQSR